MTVTSGDRVAVVGDRWEAPTGVVWLLRDTWTEAKRHLRIIPRNPDLIIFATIQPMMFVLLFVYVFGGSIQVPGYDSYEQYLLPGIFAQTVVFGSGFTGVGIADDMQKGMMERLRSLPMRQSAVLIGRTVSDLIRNTFTFCVMLTVGFAVGFRFEGSLLEGFFLPEIRAYRTMNDSSRDVIFSFIHYYFAGFIL